MIRVEALSFDKISELDVQINLSLESLENMDCKIKDIKFSSCSEKMQEGNFFYSRYSALIIYDENEEKKTTINLVENKTEDK